jgi:hypothetical protein
MSDWARRTTGRRWSWARRVQWFTLPLKADLPPGTLVRVRARWVNRRQEAGPMSSELHLRVGFPVAIAA